MKKAKYEVVYDYLRVYIDQNKFSSSTRMPSEHFLSKRLSVCRETIRKAISMLEEEGVIYTIKGSGTFFHTAMAMGLDKEDHDRNKVAIIIQGYDRDANSQFILAVNDVLKKNHITSKIFYTDNKLSNERKCLSTCLDGFSGIIIDGVKASILNPNLDLYSELYERGIPVVFYNNYYAETDFPKVLNNDKECADFLIKELHDNGHRHIAGLFLLDNYQGVQKYLGCAQAIFRYKLEFEDDYVLFLNSDDLRDIKYLDKRIWGFYKKIGNVCTAIVCCNVMFYLALKRVFSLHGVSVPQDVSVVCFDYSDDDYITEGITCSVHQGYEMGNEAANILKKMMQDANYKKKDYSVRIKPKIHIGNSIRDIKEI